MIKAIIFDFDGVIENTFDICFSIDKERHPKLTKEKFIEKFMGNYWENIPKSDKNPLAIRKFENKYKKRIKNIKINPVMKKILKTLNKKYNLFIISSTGEGNMLLYFKVNKITKLFKDVLGRESGLSKIEKFKKIFQKYNLTSKECIFITDTLGDIKESQNVSVKTIAVTWGFHDIDLLRTGHPYKIINNNKELLKTILNKP
jgi:phosphoglycolate phosphatase